MKPEDYLKNETNPRYRKMRKIQWDLAMYMHHDVKARNLFYENLEHTHLMTEVVLNQFLLKVHKHLELRDKILQRSGQPLKEYAKNYPKIG